MNRNHLVVTAACAWLLALTGIACSTGGSSAAPSPASSKDVYTVQIQSNSIANLPACTPALAGETAYVASPAGLYSCVANHWVPLPCSTPLSGAVAYASATKTVWACSQGAWTQINVQGPPGPQGGAGPTGATGPQGPATTVQVVPLPVGSAQCPAGGEEIEFGVEADGGFQIESTAVVCNGESSSPTGGEGPCTTAADCDDATPCTSDFCSSGTCVHDYAPSYTICHAAAGPCDQTEYCTGDSTVCPPDVYLPPTTACAYGSGPCQRTTYCTGSSTACPPVVTEPAGTVCSAASGCALASTCDGVGGACPAQAPAPAGTSCGNYACYNPSTCDGASLTCTLGSPQADGTSCGSGQLCHGGRCDLGCYIAGTFYYDGQTNGACLACVPGTSTTSWTPRTGSSCGTICDGSDYVAQAVCGGSDGVTCVVLGTGQFTYCPLNTCQQSGTSAYCGCNTNGDCAAGYSCGSDYRCH